MGSGSALHSFSVHPGYESGAFKMQIHLLICLYIYIFSIFRNMYLEEGRDFGGNGKE